MDLPAGNIGDSSEGSSLNEPNVVLKYRKSEGERLTTFEATATPSSTVDGRRNSLGAISGSSFTKTEGLGCGALICSECQV